MTSSEFTAWREQHELSQQAAANALGISKGSIELYERGSRRDDNRPVVIPTAVELACKYLAQRRRLRHQLEMLESGRMTTREGYGGVLVDTTKEWIGEVRDWLADIERLLNVITPESKNFRLVQIEFGPYGEMICREPVDLFRTRAEAEEQAERIAKKHPSSGFNQEHGYWWGRDLNIGTARRYVVEPIA